MARPSDDPGRLLPGDVRQGMSVLIDGEVWSIASKHPEAATFWVHRWVNGIYQAEAVHVGHMERIPMKRGAP